MPQTFNTLVFDIGGSHATASLVCDPTFKLHGTCDCDLRQGASKDELLGALEDLARRVVTQCGVAITELTGIAFALPSPFDFENGVSYMQHKHASLYGVSLRQEFSERLRLAPASIVFINDAAGYLLGEIAAGAARQGHRVIGITLGTGVGCAFAVEGEIVISGPGVPPGGEIWNIKWRDGITEDAISTRAIQGIYRSLTGESLSVKDVAMRCATDAAAAETFRRFGAEFGEVLSSISNDFHPDLIVIGGAIARSANLFLPVAHESLNNPNVHIVVSSLFESAALVGAGANWLRRSRLETAPKAMS